MPRYGRGRKRSSSQQRVNKTISITLRSNYVGPAKLVASSEAKRQDIALGARTWARLPKSN